MKAVSQSLPKSHTVGLGTFWTQTPEAICATLHCGLEGLSSDDAKRRLATAIYALTQHSPSSLAKIKTFIENNNINKSTKIQVGKKIVSE